MYNRLVWLALTVLCGTHQSLFGAEPLSVRLWDDSAPGALGQADKDIPKLTVYLPSDGQSKSSALIIYPGGGYGGLAMDHEGHQIARWANEMGMAGVICDYRHRGKGYNHPHPMLDAQRAVRLVRSRSSNWNIDPKRVGVIGFSAGGHLASTVLTHFDLGQPNATDLVDQQSCRPDFGILCYPVIAFDKPYTHKGSQKNLLGENPDPELVKSLSNETQVKSDTPPTFLWHTAEDKGVPAENSLRFYSALVDAKIAGELHVFPAGRHGLGLAGDTPGTSEWPKLCRRWLAGMNMARPN